MWERIKQPFIIMLHPIQVLNEIKQKKGLVTVAAGVLFAYFISEVVSKQGTSFIFNPNAENQVNVPMIFLVSTLWVLLFCIANWCFCTLTQGEGRFSDIFIAVSFALMPLIVLNFVSVAVSNVMVLEEQAFFLLLNAVKYIWFGYYLFLAVMIIQQYSFGKTLFSILLTVLGMAIICMLALLVFSLFQQIYIFLNSVYNELTYRL